MLAARALLRRRPAAAGVFMPGRFTVPLRRYLSDDWEFVPQSVEPTPSMRREPEAFRKTSGRLELEEIKDILNYEGAFDMVVLDTVMGTTESMVFASVESSAHLTGIALTFVSILKKRKVGNRSFVNGARRPGDDWVVVDAGKIIVHVMLPAKRVQMDLERIWNSSLPPLPVEKGMEPDELKSPYKHDADWDGDAANAQHKKERRRREYKNYMPGKKRRSQLTNQLIGKKKVDENDGDDASPSTRESLSEETFIEDSLLSQRGRRRPSYS